MPGAKGDNETVNVDRLVLHSIDKKKKQRRKKNLSRAFVHQIKYTS